MMSLSVDFAAIVYSQNDPRFCRVIYFVNDPVISTRIRQSLESASLGSQTAAGRHPG